MFVKNRNYLADCYLVKDRNYYYTGDMNDVHY